MWAGWSLACGRLHSPRLRAVRLQGQLLFSTTPPAREIWLCVGMGRAVRRAVAGELAAVARQKESVSCMHRSCQPADQIAAATRQLPPGHPPQPYSGCKFPRTYVGSASGRGTSSSDSPRSRSVWRQRVSSNSTSLPPCSSQQRQQPPGAEPVDEDAWAWFVSTSHPTKAQLFSYQEPYHTAHFLTLQFLLHPPTLQEQALLAILPLPAGRRSISSLKN